MYLAKKSYKIIFWDVFWPKIFIKSYFGVFFDQKMTKNGKKGQKLTQMLFLTSKKCG